MMVLWHNAQVCFHQKKRKEKKFQVGRHLIIYETSQDINFKAVFVWQNFLLRISDNKYRKAVKISCLIRYFESCDIFLNDRILRFIKFEMLKDTCQFYKNSCISNTKMQKFKTLKFKILTKMFITKKKKNQTKKHGLKLD